MKSPRLLGVLLISLLVAAPAVVFADDERQQVRELIDELTDDIDPELKTLGYQAIGHVGSDEQRESLEEFQDARQESERMAVGVSMIMSGHDDGVQYTAEQLLEFSQLQEPLVALGAHLSEQQLVELFEELVEEAEGQQREQVFSHLARYRGEPYQVLADQLTADDEQLRSEALEAMVATAGEPALEVAERLAGHRDADIRARQLEIADAVGDRSDLDEQVVELLEAATTDADKDIQRGAAARLVERGQQHGVDWFTDRLPDQEPDERVESLELLLEHDAQGNLDEIRPLLEEVEMALAEDDEREHEWQLLYEFAATDADSELVDDLQEKFGSTDFEDRIASVRSLGRTGYADVQQQLTDGLGEGRSDIRRFCARGIGQLGDTQLIPRLRTALQSETDTEVRLEVIDALAKMPDASAAQALRFHVNDDDAEIREAIVEALGQLALPESVQALEMLVRDRDSSVGWNAFVTLAELDEDRAQNHLRTALQNPPDDFGDYIEPTELSEEGRQMLYEEILTHSTSRVYSVAIDHAVAYPQQLMPVVRDLAAGDDIREAARHRLVQLLIDDDSEENIALLGQIIDHHGGESAADLAGWYFARQPTGALEDTFSRIVDTHDSDDDPTARYISSNIALLGLDE